MTEETERGEKRRRIRLARDKEVARNVEEPRPMCTVCKVSLRRGESRRPFPLRRASVSRILLFRRPCVDQEPRGREEGNARKRKKDRAEGGSPAAASKNSSSSQPRKTALPNEPFPLKREYEFTLSRFLFDSPFSYILSVHRVFLSFLFFFFFDKF